MIPVIHVSGEFIEAKTFDSRSLIQGACLKSSKSSLGSTDADDGVLREKLIAVGVADLKSSKSSSGVFKESAKIGKSKTDYLQNIISLHIIIRYMDK